MLLRKFLYPALDYFQTVKKHEVFYEIIIPAILSVIFSWLLSCKSFGISKFTDFIFTFIAILIGFSITTITLLTTSSNKNIDETKKTPTERKARNRNINLYRLTLITFTYCLFMEFVILGFNLGYVLLYYLSFFKGFIKYYYAINIFLISHVILLSYRNITCLYHIFMKDE